MFYFVANFVPYGFCILSNLERVQNWRKGCKALHWSANKSTLAQNAVHGCVRLAALAERRAN